MAKTSYQLIPPEFDISYSKALQSGDRFEFPRVRRKILFSSRAKKKGLTQKSLIPILAPVWASFDTTTKNLWNDCGFETGLTGWKFFLQDTALRLKNDLTGYTTPNLFEQGRVGRLAIESPATGIKISQLHPLEYFVNRKVRGSRNQYEPVAVIESFALPLSLTASWLSDLSSVGENSFAKIYLVIYSHYQGSIIETRVEIDCGLVAGWTSDSHEVTSVKGLVRGYSAFIEIHNAVGNFYFDNIKFIHSGHNWARDPSCNDINQGFTKAFAQIPKHWVDVDVAEGSYFESFYYN